jgi:hypothetical protein
VDGTVRVDQEIVEEAGSAHPPDNHLQRHEALQSPFLEKLRADPEFARETGGGCVLWKKREEVAAVLEESGQR